jgi:hypothetical protein
MSKIEILISSPAFWAIVVTFLFNGLQAITPLLSGTGQGVVNVLLLLATAYLHAGAVQKAQGIR